MLQPTDITATFHPSTLPNSRSLGIGQLNVCGVIISYSVYPSQYGLGFLVSYPSKPSMKNGVQEIDAKGKPKYFNEVYVADQNTRGMLENAIQNAMANRGIYIQPPTQQPQPSYGGQPAYQQRPNQGFVQPTATNTQQFINGQGISPSSSFAAPTHAPVNVQPTVSSPGSSVTSADELPF